MPFFRCSNGGGSSVAKEIQYLNDKFAELGTNEIWVIYYDENDNRVDTKYTLTTSSLQFTPKVYTYSVLFLIDVAKISGMSKIYISGGSGQSIVLYSDPIRIGSVNISTSATYTLSNYNGYMMIAERPYSDTENYVLIRGII